MQRDLLSRAKECELPQLIEVTRRSGGVLLDMLASPIVSTRLEIPMHQELSYRLLRLLININLPRED
jgi:hypothetical protein